MTREPQPVPSCAVEVVGGGPATPEEVAALAAAIEVVLAGEKADAKPAVSPWRWSGRRWNGPAPAGGGGGDGGPGSGWRR